MHVETPAVHRLPAGRREQALRVLKLAQELGFSLAEIRGIAPLLTQGGLPPEQVRAFVQEKIAVIDRRIGELQDLRERLVRAGYRWPDDG